MPLLGDPVGAGDVGHADQCCQPGQPDDQTGSGGCFGADAGLLVADVLVQRRRHQPDQQHDAGQHSEPGQYG